MCDTTTEPPTAYEYACSQCIDDLFHMAYITLADEDAAQKLVTEICVAGIYKYDNLEDEADIRFRLTSDLYRHVKRRLWFYTPSTDVLPESLQILTKQVRLTIAMRFSSGLSAAESGRILALAQEKYRKLINEIIQKLMTVKVP